MLLISKFLNKKNSLKKTAAVLLFLCVILVISFYYSGKEKNISNSEAVNSELRAKSDYFGLQSTDHIQGAKDARIVVIEYSDLECPWCKVFHLKGREVLKEKYISQGVSFVFRNFPLLALHKKAYDEAVTLECIALLGGEEKFWNALKNIYTVTQSEDSLTDTQLASIVESQNIDTLQLQECLADPSAREKVQNDIARGTLQGIYSTPVFAIFKDGQFHSIFKGSDWKKLDTVLMNLIHT